MPTVVNKVLTDAHTAVMVKCNALAAVCSLVGPESCVRAFFSSETKPCSGYKPVLVSVDARRGGCEQLRNVTRRV